MNEKNKTDFLPNETKNGVTAVSPTQFNDFQLAHYKISSKFQQNTAYTYVHINSQAKLSGSGLIENRAISVFYFAGKLTYRNEALLEVFKKVFDETQRKALSKFGQMRSEIESLY